MNLISLLVCLAMMLSGGYMTEDPNAAAATQITIRDAVVEIQGEHYSLNPSITLGAATENGAALLDFGMNLNDQVLFPVQAKIDDAGAGVLLGSSNTAYTFTPELFDELLGGEEIPAEVFTMIDSYAALMTSIPTYDTATREAMYLSQAEALLEVAGDVEVTEVTFTADDKEQTGKHFAFDLDSDAVEEWLEKCLAALPEEYTAAYNDYIKNLMNLVGEPGADSITDVLDLSGMEMGISGELTYNETSSVWDIVYHTKVDQTSIYLDMGYTEEDIAEMGIEPIIMDMPMTMIYHNADNAEYIVAMEQDGVTIDMTAFLIDGGYLTMGMTISEPDVATMELALDMLINGSSITVTNQNMVMDIEGTVVTFYTETDPGEEISTTTVALGYSDEAFSGSVSFFIDVTHDAITDRISAAEPQLITSMEELEGTASTGLSLAAMSMLGDVENLMNEESIAALIPAMQELFGASEMEADIYEETTAEIADTPVSSEPTFAAPEFGWLPEGYSMVENYYEGEYGCYSFVFNHADDSYGEYAMYIDVYAPVEGYENPYTYYSIDNGEVTAIDSNLLSAVSTDMEDYTSHNLWGNIQGYDVDLYSYDPALTTDDLANIAANMVFAE